MNHLYEIATGRLVSSTKLDIDEIPAGMAVKQSNKKGIWNTETLDFDPIPEKKVVEKLEFLDMFTDSELAGILAAAKNDVSVELFIKKLDLADRINIKSEKVKAALSAMESAGLLASGRADDITNG